MCEHARYTDLPIDGLGPHPLAPLATMTPMPAEVAGSDGRRRSPSARRKLWDISPLYHCPVIGTCVHVEELRRLTQKSGCRMKHDLSDYEVHISFVAAARGKNPLSLELHRLLERKHASAVRRFARTDTPEGLERLWDEALANGQVQGALWAVMTHPRAPAEMCMLAFQDIHMLSHQIGAGLSADLKALAQAKEQLAQLRREADAEAKRAAHRLAGRDARIAALELRLDDLTGAEQALALAQERIVALEQDQSHRRLRMLEQQIQSLEHREQAALAEVDALRERADAAEARGDTLEIRLAAREQDLRVLDRLLPTHEEEATCDVDGDCSNPQGSVSDLVDLSGRCILCVGGRVSLQAHYRELVQHCNGELIRHDGGLEDNRQRIEALLARADAVVCPADCVSRDAYLRTKRYCKRHAKPCVLIDRSSIGAFAAALSELGHAASTAPDPTPVDPVSQPV